MKHFIPFALSLLCAVALFASDSTKTAGKTEKLQGESTETDESLKKKLIGEWQGFVMNEDIPVQVAETRFHFLSSGTWEILGDAADAEPEPQGWFKTGKDAMEMEKDEEENEEAVEVEAEGEKYKLLLQPHAAAVANENAAIQADLIDDTSFRIANPLDDKLALCFIKKESLTFPTPKSLAGKWTLKQTDPEDKETRVAPYFLLLKEDGSYSVEQPDTELPEEWAQGTYTISGIKVSLHNKFTGTGLWRDTCFFLFGGTLRYNDSRYFVWCEKQPLIPPEPEADPPHASAPAAADNTTTKPASAPAASAEKP